MNRRKFITSTGAISLGTGLAINSLSKSAIATNININNNIGIPENVTDPKIYITFEKFEVTTRNINTNEDIKIKLNAGFSVNNLNTVDSISKNITKSNATNSISINSLAISNDSSSYLDLSSKLENKVEEEKLNIIVEIVVEHSDIGSISTGEEIIQIPITPPRIPDSIVTRENDDESFNAGGRVEGFEIEPKTEWQSIGARFSNKTSGVNTVILRENDKTVIETVDTSNLSGGDKFTIEDINLLSGTKYQLVVNESSYTAGYRSPYSGYPYLSEFVHITATIERDSVRTDKAPRVFNDIGNTGF